MKYAFIYLFTNFLSINLIAQHKYIPVSGKGKFWEYVVYIDEHTSQIESYRRIYCGNDTIIGEYKYNKLYYLKDYPVNLKEIEKNLIALIRDDSIAQKTYLLPIDSTINFCSVNEHLLFDFSLKEGDHVDSCSIDKTSHFRYNNNGYDYGRVLNSYVSLVNIFNKPLPFERITIQFESTNIVDHLPSDIEFLIEGVGFARFHNGFYYDSLANLINFCEGTFEECDVLTSNSEIEKSGILNVFPNPTNDKFRIEGYNESMKIKIFDRSGILQDYNLKDNEIDISNLQKGVYFIELIEYNNIKQIKKIVKI